MDAYQQGTLFDDAEMREIKSLCDWTNVYKVEKLGDVYFIYQTGHPNNARRLDSIFPETFVGSRVHKLVQLLDKHFIQGAKLWLRKG